MRAKWTDLAVEAAGGELREGGLSRTVVKVEDEASARRLGRPMGTYVTLACEQALTVSLETRRALAAELAKTLRGMLPEGMKTALVVGLGNRSVTPDSLGPRTAERVLVTRHIGDSLPWGTEMNSVCAAAPGCSA
ncbi:MAG: GPR endopeptidase [Christensenellales bacterium]